MWISSDLLYSSCGFHIATPDAAVRDEEQLLSTRIKEQSACYLLEFEIEWFRPRVAL